MNYASFSVIIFVGCRIFSCIFFTNLLKIINIFITFVDKYDLNVLDMQEKSLNDEHFCGPWNDLVEMIEVSAKRIVEVERHMIPYSYRRKWCVFKNRNNELFSLLALVRKLESLISHKMADVSKQMLYTERDYVENISYRLSLLTEGDLRNKALSCYQPFQALPQEEISKRTWHRQAVETDADSLIAAVFGMISEIQPQELVSRIFDQLSSICRIIDYPPEVDDQTKIEALRKEVILRTSIFEQDFDKLQADFIFDRNPSGTIGDLTNEDNLQILQSLRQTYEEKVCTNIEYGEGYKRYKVNGFDLETIALFHYHARDVQFFLNDLIHLIIAEREIKELECQIEEEKKQAASYEQLTNPQGQAENNHVIYAMDAKNLLENGMAVPVSFMV